MEVLLKNVRIGYSKSLWNAEDYKVNGVGNGHFRHSATFILEPDSQAAKDVAAAVKTVATEAWKGKADQMIKTYEGSSSTCFYAKDKTNAQGDPIDRYIGKIALSAHRAAAKRGRPTLLDNKKNPATGRPVRLTEETAHRIYDGAYVNAKINIYAQTGAQGGLRAELVTVQFYKDGEAFDSSEEGFEGIEDDDDSLA